MKCSDHIDLLGKVLNDYSRYWEEEEHMEVAIRNIKKAWRGRANLRWDAYTVQKLQDGFLRFQFKDPEVKKWVMDSRPWVLDWHDFLLVLEEWCPCIPVSMVSVDSCPFWIQADGLPVVLLSQEMGFDIGRVFGGQPLEVHVINENEGGEATNFLRIRVMVNVAKRVISGFWLALPSIDEDGDDKLLWMSLYYENLPCWCFICGRVGHLAGSCGPLVRNRMRRAHEEESNELTIIYNGGENEKPVVSEGMTFIDTTKIAYESWLSETQLREIQTYRNVDEKSPQMNREGKIVVAKRMQNGGFQENEENAISVVIEPMLV